MILVGERQTGSAVQRSAKSAKGFSHPLFHLITSSGPRGNRFEKTLLPGDQAREFFEGCASPVALRKRCCNVNVCKCQRITDDELSGRQMGF